MERPTRPRQAVPHEQKTSARRVEVSMSKSSNHWESCLHFDHHQFERRYKPFYAQRQISFADYLRMGPDNHAVVQPRPGGYPEWLFSDVKMRAVLSEKVIGRPAESIDDLRLTAHVRYQRFMRGKAPRSRLNRSLWRLRARKNSNRAFAGKQDIGSFGGQQQDLSELEPHGPCLPPSCLLLGTRCSPASCSGIRKLSLGTFHRTDSTTTRRTSPSSLDKSNQPNLKLRA
jgi:hypothetical protein